MSLGEYGGGNIAFTVQDNPEHVIANRRSLLEGLLQRRFDAVIAPKPRKFAHPDVVERPLYELQPQIYARKGHPLARAQSLVQLQGAAWACVGPSVSGPVDVLTEAHRVLLAVAPDRQVEPFRKRVDDRDADPV